MAKWILDWHSALEYPTLGFNAEPGDILDALMAPDARWEMNADQEAAETVYRFAVGGDPDYVEPTDGHVLTYSASENRYVPTAPEVVGLPSLDGEIADRIDNPASATATALSATYATKGELASGGGAPLARFWQSLAASPATTTIVRSGDSTTQGDNGQFGAPLTLLMTNGCALAGMEPANLHRHGNTGFALQDFLNYENGVPGAPTPANPWDATVALTPDLIIASWLVNDARAGATVATCVSLLEQFIALRDRDLPECDIAFWIPAALTSDVVGSDFFSPGVTAASATAVIRATYNTIRNQHPGVLVIDTAEVYGTAALPNSPLMQDQLHPQNWGHYWTGLLVGREIAPPGKEAPAMGPARRYTRTGQVIYSATGLVQVQALDWPGGATPYIKGQKATTWLLDTATADLYTDGGTVDLGTATYSTPDTHTLQINVAGVAFDTLAPAGTVVQLVGDYADDGFRTGVGVDYPDPPLLAAAATGVVDSTVAGIKKGQSVKVIPPTGFPSGYAISWYVPADNTVRITFTNTTGADINYGADEWRYRW